MRNKILQEVLNEIPKETKEFVALYTEIVARVNQLLVMKGFSQKDLAEKLDKRPSEINKWLKGDHNLTLKTIAKLQVVLEEKIINVPVTHNFKGFTKSKTASFIVYKNKKEEVKAHQSLIFEKPASSDFKTEKIIELDKAS